ncbi:hypothetical protein ABVT39_016240 [Epinephelus coioides]
MNRSEPDLIFILLCVLSCCYDIIREVTFTQLTGDQFMTDESDEMEHKSSDLIRQKLFIINFIDPSTESD